MERLSTDLLQPSIMAALQALHRFGIPKAIASDEEVTFATLADRCGLSELDTKRIVRLAIAYRIFEERSPGYVSHNSCSQMIAVHPGLDDFLGVFTEEVWPASCFTVEALQKWPLSQEPSHTGFALANGATNTFFDELRSHAARTKRFGTLADLYLELTTL